MPNTPEALVFDTGPLSHIARQGWLGPLRFIVGERCATIPDTVVAELRAGLSRHPYLGMVLDASWLVQHSLTSSAELDAFAVFASLLVAKDRNWGEAGVLAYAKVHGATAIIDDGPARNAARKHGVRAGERWVSCVTRSTKVTSPCPWHRRWQTICWRASTGYRSHGASLWAELRTRA